MKKLLLFLCAVSFCAQAWAQSDSAVVQPLAPMRMIDRHTSTKAYRMLFVGVPLVAGGVVMMSYDKSFRNLRNGYASSFHQRYDDYLQYGPAAVMLGLKACGYQSRSSWGRMLVSDAMSAAIMSIAVNSLKYSVKVMRPDGSRRNSFPSGHTATAFMTATMLQKEYGYRSPWFSIGGYTMATLVAVTRQLNNRHWMSDTMVGAGIGILSTELGYFLTDLIYKKRGLNYSSDQPIYFDRYRHPSFFGINLAFSTVLGEYHPVADTDLTFSTGPTVSLRGAWFMSPYVGFGGRLSVSNMNMTINEVAQNSTLESASAAAGVYLSYPISERWLVGSKLLGGYEHYKTCDVDFGQIGNRGGGTFGTGLSMTYVAYQNLGVRFTADYDLAPPMMAHSSEYLQRLTFGLEVEAMF